MSPRIFLSYRREDSSGHAGRLYDQLSERFGEAQIFRDVDTIEPGLDFAEFIHAKVSECDVLLAVIGRRWINAADAMGHRRLDDPSDWVRTEIASALQRGIRVIPVLVDGASLPKEKDLSADLRWLAGRHAVVLSDAGWRDTVGRLIKAIERIASPAVPNARLAAADIESRPAAVTGQRRRLLFEARQLAGATAAWGDRAESLARVARAFAAAGMVADALRIARGIDHEEPRSWALAGISAHLAPLQREDLVREALEVARSTRAIEGGGNRSWALAKVATELPAGTLREQVLDEALTVAHSLDNPDIVNFAAVHLAPLLAKAGRLDDALGIAQGITDKLERSWALGDVSAEIAAAGFLDDALQIAREIDTRSDRSRALANISRYAAPEETSRLLAEALQLALSDHQQDFGSDWAALERGKERALVDVVPAFAAAGQIVEALQLVAEIRCSGPRAWVMPKLAQELAKRGQVSEALRIARGTDNERERCRALLEVAAHV